LGLQSRDAPELHIQLVLNACEQSFDPGEAVSFWFWF